MYKVPKGEQNQMHIAYLIRENEESQGGKTKSKEVKMENKELKYLKRKWLKWKSNKRIL